MRAWLGLREGVHYRREAFAAGLARCGYTVIHDTTTRPRTGDVLCIWNRYGHWARSAEVFESHGLPVLIAENGYLGNDFAADRWYAISYAQHNGAGAWPRGGAERWDSLGVELEPFRRPGAEFFETVLLPQRGIGQPGVAMPAVWLAKATARLSKAGKTYRIRKHPGTANASSIAIDLARTHTAYTWGSGAGLKALAMGISVHADFPRWIGQQDNTDAGRLAMFRRLAWAQWRISEIKSGEAFKWLLGK